MSISNEEQFRRDSMTASIDGVKEQFSSANSQHFPTTETITARVSPWLDEKDVMGGNVTILEDSHPRTESEAFAIKEALIALADEILTAYGRDPKLDMAAGMEVTIRLKPSAWR